MEKLQNLNLINYKKPRALCISSFVNLNSDDEEIFIIDKHGKINKKFLTTSIVEHLKIYLISFKDYISLDHNQGIFINDSIKLVINKLEEITELTNYSLFYSAKHIYDSITVDKIIVLMTNINEIYKNMLEYLNTLKAYEANTIKNEIKNIMGVIYILRELVLDLGLSKDINQDCYYDLQSLYYYICLQKNPKNSKSNVCDKNINNGESVTLKVLKAVGYFARKYLLELERKPPVKINASCLSNSSYDITKIEYDTYLKNIKSIDAQSIYKGLYKMILDYNGGNVEIETRVICFNSLIYKMLDSSNYDFSNDCRIADDFRILLLFLRDIINHSKKLDNIWYRDNIFHLMDFLTFLKDKKDKFSNYGNASNFYQKLQNSLSTNQK